MPLPFLQNQNTGNHNDQAKTSAKKRCFKKRGYQKPCAKSCQSDPDHLIFSAHITTPLHYAMQGVGNIILHPSHPGRQKAPWREWEYIHAFRNLRFPQPQ